MRAVILIGAVTLSLAVVTIAHAAGFDLIAIDDKRGQPIRGATVVLHNLTDGNRHLSATTNPVASFRNLPATDFHVSIYSGTDSMDVGRVGLTSGRILRLQITFSADPGLDGLMPRPDFPSTATSEIYESAPDWSSMLPRSLPLFSAGPNQEIRHQGLALGRAELLPRSMIGHWTRRGLGASVVGTARDAGTLNITHRLRSLVHAPPNTIRTGNGSANMDLSATTPLLSTRRRFSELTVAAAPRIEENEISLPVAAVVDLVLEENNQGALLLASNLTPDSHQTLGIAQWATWLGAADSAVEVTVGASRMQPSSGGRTLKTRELASSKHGARAVMTHTLPFLGPHHIAVAAEGYHRRGSEGDRLQAALAISDHWSPRASLSIESEIRAERTELGTHEVLPQLGFAYNWMRQGRARLFASVGRHLRANGSVVGQGTVGSEIELVEGLALLTSINAR